MLRAMQLLLTLTLLVSLSAGISCDTYKDQQDYESSYNGVAHRFFKDKLNWDDAAAACECQGADWHLATVESKDHFDWIKTEGRAQITDPWPYTGWSGMRLYPNEQDLNGLQYGHLHCPNGPGASSAAACYKYNPSSTDETCIYTDEWCGGLTNDKCSEDREFACSNSVETCPTFPPSQAPTTYEESEQNQLDKAVGTAIGIYIAFVIAVLVGIVCCICCCCKYICTSKQTVIIQAGESFTQVDETMARV